jgi:ABC-type transporter Mla subunit MlaD
MADRKRSSDSEQGLVVPDPSDLLKAWQDAIREVGGVAASLVSGSAGKAGELLEPMQKQAEQVQKVLERQLEFERELVSRAIAPARATLEMAEQATIAYRAQATAFRAAAASFGQLAELMEQQAEVVERVGGAVRDPLAALRAANEQLRGERSGEDEDEDEDED